MLRVKTCAIHQLLPPKKIQNKSGSISPKKISHAWILLLKIIKDLGIHKYNWHFKPNVINLLRLRNDVNWWVWSGLLWSWGNDKTHSWAISNFSVGREHKLWNERDKLLWRKKGNPWWKYKFCPQLAFSIIWFITLMIYAVVKWWIITCGTVVSNRTTS